MQERKNYTDRNYHPFLFFVIFGVSGEELQVSREKHHVERLPEGLELHSLNRKEHAGYLDGFFGGELGKILRSADEELFIACREAENCVILKGEAKEDSDFGYMVNAVGFLQAFIDQGAKGILDLPTFSLYSPEDFTKRFFGKEINAQNHVVILVSEEEDGYWLHTRGMMEFGRPDFSMHHVKREQVPDCKEILDQMIYYGGEGVFLDGEFRLHTYSGDTFRVRSSFVEDFDNDDFNNAYCEVEILEEASA